ncbi:hypothetical protein [Brevundimonas sp. UBA2416]|uniref:hypothetical protein n=1 Tax=Brevundimonas sp. UBA2416 TaxID=1946124 RepID=UPI0025C2014C|nr:hypothetical protein [Brevundimonas sp. UBA2416]HRJ64516.1 hypothetical protein [Brevundimonas sp.]
MGPALTARRLLLKLLAVTGVAVVSTAAVSLAWAAIGGGPLGVHGLIALSLGVFGTVGLTWGLMALAFKSSREGWDDRPDDPDKP